MSSLFGFLSYQRVLKSVIYATKWLHMGELSSALP